MAQRTAGCRAPAPRTCSPAAATTWSQQAYLKSPTQDRGDSMGTWITISDDGNTVVAGALDEDTLTPGINVVQGGHSGSRRCARRFVRRCRVGVRAQRDHVVGAGQLQSLECRQDDWFGVRLAVSGDGNTLAVSAPNEDSAAQGINGKQDDNSADEAGAVYVFTRTRQHVGVPRTTSRARTPEKFDEFGSAIALSRDGRTMAVGARFEDGGAKGFNGRQDDNSVSDSGAVYIFVR